MNFVTPVRQRFSYTPANMHNNIHVHSPHVPSPFRYVEGMFAELQAGIFGLVFLVTNPKSEHVGHTHVGWAWVDRAGKNVAVASKTKVNFFLKGEREITWNREGPDGADDRKIHVAVPLLLVLGTNFTWHVRIPSVPKLFLKKCRDSSAHNNMSALSFIRTLLIRID